MTRRTKIIGTTKKLFKINRKVWYNEHHGRRVQKGYVDRGRPVSSRRLSKRGLKKTVSRYPVFRRRRRHQAFAGRTAGSRDPRSHHAEDERIRGSEGDIFDAGPRADAGRHREQSGAGFRHREGAPVGSERIFRESKDFHRRSHRKNRNFSKTTIMISEEIQKKIRPGAKVKVYEGKTPFEGLVIARKHGSEPGATFTVRAIVAGVGVEKVYPIHSPTIVKAEIVSARRKSIAQSFISSGIFPERRSAGNWTFHCNRYFPKNPLHISERVFCSSENSIMEA